MNALLATVTLTPVGQVLAVLVGLLVMAGSLVAYKKCDIDGYVAFWFSVGGFALAVFGIGGESLVRLINSSM